MVKTIYSIRSTYFISSPVLLLVITYFSSITLVVASSSHHTLQYNGPYLTNHPLSNYDDSYVYKLPWNINSLTCRGGASSTASIPSSTSSTTNSDPTQNSDSSDEWLKVESVADINSVSSTAQTDPLKSNQETSVDNSINSQLDASNETSNTDHISNSDSNLETSEQSTESQSNTPKSLIFDASKPGDGSESDPDGLPTRFLNMQKGNREKAIAAFEHTKQWRLENNVNSILTRPHPKFDLCRRVFPVYIPGRDLVNNIIIVQEPGKIDFDYAHEHNVTSEDLLTHYIYVVEYCWNILDPGPPDKVMTTIMNLEGFKLSRFRKKEVREFGVRFVKTMSDHYPQRSYRTLLINAPGWFNLAWALVQPILRESTKQKIIVLNGGEKQDQTLIDICGIDSVPKSLLSDPDRYLNNSDNNSATHIESGMDSDIEQNLRLFCKNVSDKGALNA